MREHVLCRTPHRHCGNLRIHVQPYFDIRKLVCRIRTSQIWRTLYTPRHRVDPTETNTLNANRFDLWE